MMSNKGDKEELKQCPYDPSHQILTYRFQTHLSKCRRNYPDANLVPCVHNSVHQVPEPELQYHHETCADRIHLDKLVFGSDVTSDEKFPLPKLQVNSEENWDNEYVETYDPTKYCEEHPILRNQCTLPSAQRKHFRKGERQRMQSLVNQTNEAEIPEERRQDKQEKTIPRRPHAASAALDNQTVNDMFTIIHRGRGNAVVPKLVQPTKDISSDINTASTTPGSSNVKNDNEQIINNERDREYPPLGGGGARPKTNFNKSSSQNSWSSVAKPSNGVKLGKPLSRGRGRGTQLKN